MKELRASRHSRIGVLLGLGVSALLAGGLVATVPGAGIERESRETGVVPGRVQADTLEDLAAEALPAVVLLDVSTAADSRQGSGFLVRPDGRILTNHHVIRDARGIRVKLANGDVYDHVKILGVDERRDLAVIQIAGFDLPYLLLGNSDSVRIGHPVVHIGSPLGLENTVSTGIVSGRRQEPAGYQLIQVSAPASVGSSGGPVLSQGGRVIGVAAAQLRSGQNLNFAVPINYARGLLENLASEPLEVLMPTSAGPASQGEPIAAGATDDDVVNRGLSFDMHELGGYTIQLERHTPQGSRLRTRITYRRIETVGDMASRFERYAESEWTQSVGPFATPQTIRRERSRAIVRAGDLTPISARGELTWWTGEEWRQADYDLRFEQGLVRGVIRDSLGSARELDHTLPSGVLLRETRDFAFGTLATDDLVGRSVEFVTFDSWTGELAHDRYDVLGETKVEAAGETRDALRVNVVTDLTNTMAYFAVDRPRVLLRRENEAGREATYVTELHITPYSAPDEDSGSN